MSLPRPPISATTPIPNQPFSAPEVYYLEGNQGHLPLGQGLYIDPATGDFTNIEPSPYIYCTPQYSNLPVTYPPYDCETAVNTAGVTDFTNAWFNCQYLTDFPCVDSSAVTDFSYAWEYCYALTSFPTINTSAGENFTYSWAYSGLTTFPKLNTSNGSIFYGTWCGCYDLASFPELDLTKGEVFKYAWYYCESLTSFPETFNLSSGKNFYGAWSDCTSLTSFPYFDAGNGEDFGAAWTGCTSLITFPAGMFDNCSTNIFNGTWQNCALDQTSVDSILISIDASGQINGTLTLSEGTSAAPSATGLAAKASLQAKGWTVTTN